MKRNPSSGPTEPPLPVGGAITIALVEDDSQIRAGLQAIIDEEDGLRCVGSFASAEEALIEISQLRPKVVIMDVNLGGMNGIECVRRLCARPNPPQILMLTVRQDSEIIFDSLAAGASGYLLKPPTADQLIEAIRDCSAGGAPMTSSIARRVVQSFRQMRAASEETESLTAREVEVLELLVKGFAYKEVAAELEISYSTVQRHVENIYGKLHVHCRAHAVSKYLGI